MRRGLLVLALLWTIGVGLWFAFGPVYSESSAESVMTSNGTSAPALVAEKTTNGLAVNGARVLLVVLGVPLLLAAAPLFVPRGWQRRVATASALLVLAGSILAAMSVGLFYLPAALILGVAAAWPARARSAS